MPVSREMTNERSDTTLADYLRVIGQRKLFIAAVALICTAVALGVSLLQKPTYQATASLNVRDPTQDLTLLGTAFVSGQTPLQLATAHASQVTRPEVVRAAKRALHTPLTQAQLKQAVAVSVDPNSDLVMITAQARRANDAAAIANAFAQRDAAITTTEARVGYAAAARKLSDRLHRVSSAQAASTKAIYIDQLSRLQDLSSVATPVSVNTSAGIPGSPSSPKPVRNAIAALIFGLFLAIALAYVRDRFDRRLRHADDVEGQLEFPVVGHVRASALGHAGGSAGGSGTGLGPLDAIDEESFRILRQNVRYLAAGDELRTVLVTSSVASEGKSTVAACLAMASAAAGNRTLLVECDLRRPVLAKRFGLSSVPGLTDYLTGHAEPQQIMQTVPAVHPASVSANGNGHGPADGESLICIVAGTIAPRPAELLASQAFQSFLDEVGEVYDTVILDSPPLLAVADSLELIPRVDSILMCVRLDQTTRDQARAAMAALGRLPDRPTAIVLTNVSERAGGYYSYYYRSAVAA